MTPAAGARIGPYEIVGRLGAGGMGEVFRARDARLGRDVALKVLPPELANDAARRARFEQEARAAAALNHANIMAVYDIGTDNGVGYMVTELVSGETLEAMLERGPVPVRKLLDIAVQIAEGMACAHAARITHRDLKPANIMITGPESGQPGRVKILDFGLAKQAATIAATEETVAMHQTEPGMILGTVNYMSPEQARGKPADHRSDQFSFGIILYEMATGRKPFQKAETVQTMSAILTEDPPPIEAKLPAPLRWTIERCLAKDPADRYDSTRDLYQSLRSLREHLSEASGIQPAMAEPIAAAPTKRRARWPIPLAIAAAVLAALATATLLRGPQTPDQSMYRFTPFSFEPGGNGRPVWAPDGKSVAYAARQNSGPFQLFIRELDSPSAVQITHTSENIFPTAWSPDGQRIFINSDRKPDMLWSIAKVGGEPEPVMSLQDVGEGSVSPDGRSAVFLKEEKGKGTGVWISSPLGSPPKPYTPAPFPPTEYFNAPRVKFSPDGKSVLLFINRREEQAWLLPYPPTSSKPPHRVLTTIPGIGGTPDFSWMPDSRHVVLSLATSTDSEPQLWMADTRSEERFALTSGTAGRSTPAVSPDGHKLIFTELTGHYDIATVDLATATPHQTMSTERDQLMPSWAVKQPLLTFVTDRNGPNEIWLHSPSGPDRPLVMQSDFPAGSTQAFMAPAISPDGDRVIFARVEGNVGGVRLWMASVASRAIVRVTNDSALEGPGSWSPDGNWFTYTRLLNGTLELVKVKTTGQSTPVLLEKSIKQFVVPAWSPTGEWIGYAGNLISPDGAMKRSIGDHRSPFYMFSSDGKLLYGIRTEQDKVLLFSVDIASSTEKILGDLGRELRPANNVNPSIRFSLAPDGKSFVYSFASLKRNMWLLEGFAAERSFWSRFR